MICAPPREASSNELADWLELEVLASAHNVAPLVAVNEALEIEEDAEPEDLDEENIIADRRLQKVASAISERITTIGSAYPFQIDASGSSLRLVEPLCEAACTYLFCLITSHGVADGLLFGDPRWAPDLIKARELFQICATVSAAGWVQGPAYSVGWPRPDSSSFLTKLQQVYAQLREGVVYASIPPGAPPQVKDDGIDVIAWKFVVPSGPGTNYFLGQAATGADWHEKSLKGAVAEAFHATWFEKPPASQVMVGTIVPFVLPTDADSELEDHEEQEKILGRWNRETARHGLVLFRHRVAHYVAVGMQLSAGAFAVERVTDLPRLCDYVEDYRDRLRASNGA